MYSTILLQISIISFILILSATITSADVQTNSSEELKEIINTNYSQFTQFIKDHKPSELAETLYTRDAKFYPPNGGMVEGTEGVTAAFEGLIGAGLVIEPEAQEVEIFGDHAYEYGIGTVYNRESEEIRKERYVCIWKNVDGDWKIYLDIVQGIQMQLVLNYLISVKCKVALRCILQRIDQSS